MRNLDRRLFMGSSVAAVAGLSAWRSTLLADQTSQESAAPAMLNSGPDSLFLTYQNDPCTTITIQWIGPATTADCEIRFERIDRATWRTHPTITKPYPGTDLRVYRSELTGLQPGTDYKFQIGVDQAMFRFRTMPARINDEFRFITGGDAGVGEHAVATNRLAALQDPSFVLIAGDLAYDNGTSPETFTKFLQNYRATMVDSQGRLIPMISTLGNHEVQGGYKARREQAPSYLSVFDGFFAETTYGTLDFGDYLSLVLLDTGHIAPIAGEQTDWLEKMLAARQEMPHLIVANHVPAYPSYRSPSGNDDQDGTGQKQRELWCPLFERFKVDVVLEHHDHTFKRTKPLIDGRYDQNGIVYLGDGSWGKLRVPKTPEERPYLAKVAHAYHMTVHSLQGDDRFHLALTDTGRIADIYATHKKRPSRRG